MSESGLDLNELRDAIRQLLAEASDPRNLLLKEESGATDTALWRQMAELGWFGMIIDEDHGGLGLGLEELGVLYEELGRALSPVPVLQTMLAAHALMMAGSAQQKAEWLPRVAAGELRVALTLPQPGHQLPALDAKGRVTGTSRDVLFADAADLLALPVETAAGRRDFVLLPPDAAGVAVAPQPLFDLTRNMAAISLDHVQVAPEQVLTLDSADWDRLVDHADIALAADAVGGMQHIFEITVEYLKVRQQFGRPIGSFQALKHRAANWKVLQEAAIALAANAVSFVARQGDGAGAVAAAAKYYCSNVYADIAGDAVQLHGGIGFTWEHPCHLFLKRAKLNQVLFGGTSAKQDKVAALAFA
ncbi:MAG TPA: acyl-CoA dehydrogenase family protein [Sphingomonadales bacterium]